MMERDETRLGTVEILPSTADLDALDRTLDRVLAGDADAHPLAARVRAGLQVEVSADAARAHLTALAGAASIGEARRRRGRRALVASLAAAVVLTLGSGSALAASSDDVPGDPFYGLKRAAERVAIAMRRAPESKAALHLQFADRRLAEIRALVEAGRDPSGLGDDYARALAAAASWADAAFDRGADVSSLLAAIEDRARLHLSRLEDVLGRAPEQARKGLENAIENAEDAAERARQRAEQGRGKPDEPPGKDRGRGR